MCTWKHWNGRQSRSRNHRRHPLLLSFGTLLRRRTAEKVALVGGLELPLILPLNPSATSARLMTVSVVVLSCFCFCLLALLRAARRSRSFRTSSSSLPASPPAGAGLGTEDCRGFAAAAVPAAADTAAAATAATVLFWRSSFAGCANSSSHQDRRIQRHHGTL